MIVNKFIEQLNKETLYEKTFKVGSLPNEGKIMEGLEEAIITFDDNNFIVYVFEGIFKPIYSKKYQFLFKDIKNIEIGKYNFKDRYLKLFFDEEKHLVFTYLLKQRKYEKQALYVNEFLDVLYKISKEED